ncbi:MAG: ParB N-terminal domain-containing protein [Bacteroidota bacterium]|jgi:ParB/RepB/Spo0J family partition protein
MSGYKMEEFEGEVEKIPLKSIKPSKHNPRGPIERNETFLRLVSSIDDVGVIVPIVVRELSQKEGQIKYELVDGERRYWAAIECRREEVPAHILSGSHSLGKLRKLMFHTHMTREQWGAIAQCRALEEVYPKLVDGLTFSEKADWVKKLAKETVMSTMTARDRINVLSWPRELKSRIYDFDDKQNTKDIYSYVLAIEVSIVEPARSAFPDFYSHGQAVERNANKVRAALLEKTISGIETGLLNSREQIRSISPLFNSQADAATKKSALNLFKEFVDRREIQFEDLRAEIVAKLPDTLKQKPPKPQRVIASLRALELVLRDYGPSYIDNSVQRENSREKIRREFIAALEGVISASKALRSKLR